MILRAATLSSPHRFFINLHNLCDFGFEQDPYEYMDWISTPEEDQANRDNILRDLENNDTKDIREYLQEVIDEDDRPEIVETALQLLNRMDELCG